MKICVATYATGVFSEVCDITDANKADYCRRHEYGFERNHEDGDHGAATWERYLWYLRLMSSKKWQWFYFLDADAIFTNFTLKLESIIQPEDRLIFPLDAVMIQSGGFLAKNCGSVEHFFSRLIQERPKHATDQIAMEALLPTIPGLARMVPQRVMGSYDYGHYHNLGGNYVTAKDRDGNDGQWQPGDFIFHAPGMPIASKVSVLKAKLKRIVVE